MVSVVINLIAALCQTASGIFALWALFHIPKIHRRLNAQLLASQEAKRVAESIRDTFLSVMPRVSPDPRLEPLIEALAQCLPEYIAELPALLAAKPVFPSLNGFVNAPTYFLSSPLRDGSSLDELIAALNDPMLSLLWEIRSPSALCEMLRYCLDFTRSSAPDIAPWSHAAHRADIKNKHQELWNRWGTDR